MKKRLKSRFFQREADPKTQKKKSLIGQWRLRIDVCEVKQRSVEEVTWCAFCQEVKPLFWKDGKLLCFEANFYPKGLRLIVRDTCVANMPTYTKTVRVEGTADIPSATLPVVRASAVAERILRQALIILKR